MPISKRRVLSASLFGLLLGFVSLPLSAAAQTTAPGEWTWMGGSSMASQPGVYGTLGTHAAGNIPGGRDGAATWTDSGGNLWLFGGVGLDANDTSGYLNDLWEFNPSTSEWTWIDGSSTAPASCPPYSYPPCGQPGIYGTLGTPAAQNIPAGRAAASYWTDSSGNLWLFGGFGFDANGNFGYLNDLWEFNSSTNQWAWMGGSSTAYQPGVYGTLGVPAAGNIPGSRQTANSWTDSSGNFWLFGGDDLNAYANGDEFNNGGELNDLWEFNPSTNQWAWMGGNQSGAYGTLGVPAAGNIPGDRGAAVSWVDSSGNLWLFGGGASVPISMHDSMGYIFNDLWEFSPSTNEWTWMGGSSTVPASCVVNDHIITNPCGQPGGYGTLGTPSYGNVPGGREAAVSWVDSSGNFWLFGGWGFDAYGNFGHLNDLWEFNPAASEWTWMGGSNVICAYYGMPSGQDSAVAWTDTNGVPSGFWGTMGTPAIENMPSCRAGASAWTDSSGNFWLFGGSGSDAAGTEGSLNDVWEYQLSLTHSITTVATPVFSLASGTFATPQTVVITDATPGAAIYYTTEGGGHPSWTLYTGPIAVAAALETISARAVDNNYFSSDYATATYTILHPAATATPTFSVAAGTYTAVQNVTISDATAGATIYYTTDGTTPTTSSTFYTGGWVYVSSSETLKAIATASRYEPSAVASASYTINLPPPAATPTFSVAAGTYSAAQTVTISDATPGATIYYAIDQSPSLFSAVYGGPIIVSSSETLYAMATASGYSESPEATAAYIINLPTAATPTFSVAAGGYIAAQTVTISDATPGATIYYAIDQSPSLFSAVYGGPIIVSSSERLEAFATASGYYNSAVATAAYTINSALATTTTALESNMAASSYGELVTLTATVSASSGMVPDGGTVTFMNGTTQLGVGTLSSGTASLYNLDLPTGIYSVTAFYGGDYNFSPSTSTALSLTVSIANTSTKLTSSQNPSDAGQYVTFTATVSGQFGETPTGTVLFSNGSTTLGTVSLSGNAAVFTATVLPVDMDSISAAYSGDTNFAGSTSNTVSQVVITGLGWTWMGGNSTVDQPGVYGTLGVPAAGNIPGSRQSANSWTDSKGNLWLFGGERYDANGNVGNLNDLWEFSPSTDQWTWMGGSSTVVSNGGQSGVYGTLGVPAAGNIPGSRSSSMSWTDSSGNLWLFGGYGSDANGDSGYLNDLWEFNPSTNQWAWMGGSSTVGSNGVQSGVYGTLGVPAAGNIPGSRQSANSWTDRSGNLWLFGGFGVDANGTGGDLNDLWEFNPSTDQWAWMGGSSTVPAQGEGQSGVYGTLGVFDAGNIPGSRDSAMSWTDSNGHLWLFGGSGYDANGHGGFLNDLWEFSPSTYEWAWMGGSSTPYQPGVYGTWGVPAAGNIPGGRASAMSWTDSSGNPWLFGGSGYDANGNGALLWRFGGWDYDANGNVGNLNDFWEFSPYTIWEFSPPTDQWAWMGGSSAVPQYGVGQPGVYGTLGVPTAGNIPGSRASAMSWTDSSGNLWLFGGSGHDANGNGGELNDLWKYELPATAMPTFSVAAGTYTTIQSATISDAMAGATIYYTTDGTTPTTSSTVYGSPIAVSSTETLKAIATATGCTTSPVATAAFTINLPPTAAPAFSVAAGTYTTIQSVTIGDAMAEATIYYTTDGTTPTTSSTAYSNPIIVSSTDTIEAIAVASGYSSSAVATAAYTINLPPTAAPAFSVPAGTYTSVQTVTISDATAGAAIYYTTDGTTPTTSSTVYSGPIIVLSTETIEVISMASGYSNSAVATATYNLPPDFTVSASLASLTIVPGQSVVKVMVTPLNSFNSAVSFSCTSGLPAGATCSFFPATVMPSGAPASTTLTVTTAAASAALHRKDSPLFPGSVLAVALCCLGWKKRRRLPMLLLLAVSVVGMGLLNGCGGASPVVTSSQPVISTVTVTATSGSLSHTTTFSLTIN